MRPYYDRSSGRPNHHWPYECEFHASDAWLLVDAIVTIVAAVITIFVLVLRHPLTVVSTAFVAWVLGTATGWW